MGEPHRERAATLQGRGCGGSAGGGVPWTDSGLHGVGPGFAGRETALGEARGMSRPPHALYL